MNIERDADTVTYRSDRRWPRSTARSLLTVRAGERIAPAGVSDLEHFVTARWALGSTLFGQPTWAEVDHVPWPLHRAEIVECDESVLAAAGLPTPRGEPFALWSPGVEVRIGLPRRVRP